MNDIDAANFMLAALLLGDSGKAIEAQERRGQSSLVRGQNFPIECPRAALEQWGFVFGEPIGDLFVSVTLPEGWTKEGTDHAMWSYVVDDKGRRRIAIFYKAAFYDRRAFARITPRYKVEHDAYASEVPQPRVRFWVTDGGIDTIYEITYDISTGDEQYRDLDSARIDVGHWLDENRRGWRDAAGSWTVEAT